MSRVSLCFLLPLAIIFLPYPLISLFVGPINVSWDKCWNRHGSCSRNITVKEAPIHFTDEALEDLKLRLRSRVAIGPSFFPGVGGDVQEGYGISSQYLEQVLNYWENDYDWRNSEAKMNTWSPKSATIDGIVIHFFHIKPSATAKVIPPTLMVHGWPGSVWEFNKFIDLVQNPAKEDILSDFVIPSLPGYGFSEAASTPGMDVCQTGVLFFKLMNELYPEQSFACQGGDWGSMVCQCMGLIRPDALTGLHLNLFSLISPLWSRIFLPHWQFNGLRLLKTFTYFFHQSVVPDTVGAALRQSPAGLAAWILEKMVAWSDPASNLTSEDLVPNLMIYWLTDSITSSVRYYKENLIGSLETKGNLIGVVWYKLHVPTALSSFPCEIITPPLHPWILKSKYTNLIHFAKKKSGGHFAALEQPQLFYQELQAFFRALYL